MADSGEGLRARRRRETTREIHEAAIRLAEQHGFDQITVEMISVEAGVSRRTFFNYFASKEAAVVGGPAGLPEGALAAFLAAEDGEPAHVLRDLVRLLVHELEQNAPQRGDMRRVMTLTQEHPGLLATLLATFDAYEQVVADAVARRIGQQPHDEVPALLASLALATIRTGMRRWSSERFSGPGDRSHETADGPGGSLLAEVEHSVSLLESLLVT